MYINLKTILVFFLIIINIKNEQKSSLKLFYDSSCDKCTELFSKTFRKISKFINEEVKIDIIPSSKSKTFTMDNYHFFKCPNGPSQCDINMKDSCIFDNLNTNFMKFRFFSCHSLSMIKYKQDYIKSLNLCGSILKIDTKNIIDCFNNKNDKEKIFSKNVEESMKLNFDSDLNIIINEKKLTKENLTLFLEDPKKVICSNLNLSFCNNDENSKKENNTNVSNNNKNDQPTTKVSNNNEKTTSNNKINNNVNVQDILGKVLNAINNQNQQNLRLFKKLNSLHYKLKNKCKKKHNTVIIKLQNDVNKGMKKLHKKMKQNEVMLTNFAQKPFRKKNLKKHIKFSFKLIKNHVKKIKNDMNFLMKMIKKQENFFKRVNRRMNSRSDFHNNKKRKYKMIKKKAKNIVNLIKNPNLNNTNTNSNNPTKFNTTNPSKKIIQNSSSSVTKNLQKEMNI